MKSGASRPSSSAYHGQLRLFLLPYLIGTLILVVIPALATAVVAFTKYNSVQAPVWAGLQNFRDLLASPLVRLSLSSTLILMLLAVPMRLLVAFALALLLQARQPGFGLYRALVYLPTVMPEAAYALIWLWIFNPLYGPLSIILTRLGLPPVAFLLEPTTARLAVVIVLTFQAGEGFLILLAGLQNIPRAYYEAARVDGATSWQCFWRLTLPLILPWLMLLTFRDMLMSVQNSFAPSYVMTYGGPYYSTMFVPLLIYELSFDYFDFGLSAAMLVLAYLLVAFFIVAIIRLARGRGVLDV